MNNAIKTDLATLELANNFPAHEPILLAYQRRAFESDADVTIEEKSRRVGITWAVSAKNVMTASKHKSRAGKNVFYVGCTQKMAAEYIAACALFAKALNQIASAVEQGIFTDEDGDKNILTYAIYFPNSGFKITALSSSPSNLRGMQGDVVLDEFAFHKNPAELLKSAIPLIMWGAKIHIISTHNGVDNAFNALINDVRAGKFNYIIHRTTLDDALADGLYKRICYITGKQWTIEAEHAWRDSLIKNLVKEAADEEFFCIPNKSGGSALSRAVIESCMSRDYPVIRLEKSNAFNELPEAVKDAEVVDFCTEQLQPVLDKLDKNQRHCFGEDFGRLSDLTVIDAMVINQNMSRTVPFSVELRNIPFNQQRQILFYIVDRLPRLISGALDAGGNGMYLAEQARLRYGSGRIFEVKFSESWYLEQMPKFKAAFDDHSLTIPADADQLDDLRALQVINGVIRLPKGKTDALKSRHGDSAISKALAYFASSQNAYEIDYTPAPSKAAYWGDDV